ncbi:hypothetical protein BDZ97DRAFT_1843919, partial [Flammula alnicola]
MKKEYAAQSQAVWEKRLAFSDLKGKFPSLNDKVDEELLVDKERSTKRPEVASSSMSGSGDSPQGMRSNDPRASGGYGLQALPANAPSWPSSSSDKS